MSFWTRPTTADVAIRAFGSSRSELFCESTYGMLNILSPGELECTDLVAHDGVWSVECTSSDCGLLLIRWLDEVLYQLEVNDRWLIQMQGKLEENEGLWGFSAQVSWIISENVEREIEIKAVTSHELQFKQINPGEIVESQWIEIPTIQGPGWFCDVVFDI